MKKWPFESLVWTGALLYLMWMDPSQAGISICPLHLYGITWCPGCGLGHSIAWLMEGELHRSIHAHWLGIPTLLAILHRLYVIHFHKPERSAHLAHINEKIRSSYPS